MTTRYINARVYTGEGFTDRFAVSDGRFVSPDAPADETVDLGGRFVCAGFNDTHMHLLNLGQTLSMADLAHHTGSLTDVLDCLRAHIRETSPAPGTWVRGRGFNQDYFADEKRFPTRHDLDAVSTEHPICITRACGHICAVNTAALTLLGITWDTPQPEGGRIGMDESGEPNGQFFETGLDLVSRAIPLPTDDDLRRMLSAACRRVNSYGITSCHSDDYEVFSGLGYERVMAVFQQMAQDGSLTVRVNEQAHFTNPEALRRCIARGDHAYRSERFRSGPLKMLGDGSLGARTAYLSRPYADAPTTCGIPVYTQDQFNLMCEIANEAGMSIAVHAIGDAILDCILDAYERALTKHPRQDHRHGIVHCQITRPDQLERIKRLGLHVYTQSIFLDYDTRIVHARVGEELAASSYAAKTHLRSGVTLSNGSDAPVEEPIVLRGIQCAVTRRPIGSTEAPYRPEEALSIREAIDSFTKWAAYPSREENEKGCIREGMLADFTVLDQDPFAVSPEEIRAIPVAATYLEGVQVYGDVLFHK